MIELSREIELLRDELNKQIDEEDSLLSSKIYETSRKLDESIMKYYEIRNKKKGEMGKIRGRGENRVSYKIKTNRN